jgi:hypothetical protein
VTWRNIHSDTRVSWLYNHDTVWRTVTAIQRERLTAILLLSTADRTGDTQHIIKFIRTLGSRVGRDSSVSIVTHYGLDGPESNAGGGDIFRTRPDRPWGPSSLLHNVYRVFPGGKAAGAWR